MMPTPQSPITIFEVSLLPIGDETNSSPRVCRYLATVCEISSSISFACILSQLCFSSGCRVITDQSAPYCAPVHALRSFPPLYFPPSRLLPLLPSPIDIRLPPGVRLQLHRRRGSHGVYDVTVHSGGSTMTWIVPHSSGNCTMTCGRGSRGGFHDSKHEG